VHDENGTARRGAGGYDRKSRGKANDRGEWTVAPGPERKREARAIRETKKHLARWVRADGLLQLTDGGHDPVGIPAG